MNEIVNNFLLAGDKFMCEMHLRQPRSTYSACGPFTKYEERIQKFKETEDSSFIDQNKLDKACFYLDMAYRYFQYLPRRTALNNILCDKAFNIAKNSQYGGYQCGIDSMIYNFFDKKTFGSNTSATHQLRERNLADGAVKSEIA